MKITLILTLLSSFVSLAAAQNSAPALEITLRNNDQREQQTKTQLLRLVSAYDVSNWIFTRKINIESNFDTIPY